MGRTIVHSKLVSKWDTQGVFPIQLNPAAVRVRASRFSMTSLRRNLASIESQPEHLRNQVDLRNSLLTKHTKYSSPIARPRWGAYGLLSLILLLVIPSGSKRCDDLQSHTLLRALCGPWFVWRLRCLRTTHEREMSLQHTPITTPARPVILCCGRDRDRRQNQCPTCVTIISRC